MTEIIDRNAYIGSSDAKDILDGNWHKLFMQKTGRTPREDLSDQFNVQLGIYTENFHLDWTIRRMIEAGEIQDEMRAGRQRPQSPEGVDYVSCHVDAIVKLPPQHVPDAEVPIPAIYAPVETKHSSGARSAEELMGWYMPQVQHQLWCTGASKAVVSIIQGNKEPERIWVGRSEEYIAVYAAACARFWRHVERDQAPAGFSPTVVEPKVLDAIPLNGKTRQCMDGDNAFLSIAQDMIDTEQAAKVHEKAKKDLKALMPADVGEMYSAKITLKRDARGAIRMTVHQQEKAA